MLLVHMGSPERAKSFFDARWPEARAVSDPSRSLYRAFGLARGSLGQLFGPRVWAAGLTAIRHGVGLPVGNTAQLAGAFAVFQDQVLASSVAAHAGDPPRLDELQLALKTCTEANGA